MIRAFPSEPDDAALAHLQFADAASRLDVSRRLVERHGAQTQSVLYRLLTGPSLALRHRAALALHVIDELAPHEPTVEHYRGVYVECLGPLRLYDGDREIRLQDWTSLQAGNAGWLKVGGILAYLIHRRQAGARRDELGAAVWGRPPSPSSLARTLSTLRATLAQAISPDFAEAALAIDAERCVLAPHSYLTDAQIFEGTVRAAYDVEHAHGLAAAAPLYEIALQRYHGHYMEDAPAHMDCYEERRHQLLNDVVISAERLAEHYHDAGQHRRCAAICAQALEHDPASDDLAIWQMRAYDALNLRGPLERAFLDYLRAAGVDPRSADGEIDPVVEYYASISRARELGA